VLARFSEEEKIKIKRAVDKACQAVDLIISGRWLKP